MLIHDTVRAVVTHVQQVWLTVNDTIRSGIGSIYTALRNLCLPKHENVDTKPPKMDILSKEGVLGDGQPLSNPILLADPPANTPKESSELLSNSRLSEDSPAEKPKESSERQGLIIVGEKEKKPPVEKQPHPRARTTTSRTGRAYKANNKYRSSAARVAASTQRVDMRPVPTAHGKAKVLKAAKAVAAERVAVRKETKAKHVVPDAVKTPPTVAKPAVKGAFGAKHEDAGGISSTKLELQQHCAGMLSLMKGSAAVQTERDKVAATVLAVLAKVDKLPSKEEKIAFAKQCKRLFKPLELFAPGGSGLVGTKTAVTTAKCEALKDLNKKLLAFTAKVASPAVTKSNS